MEQVIIRPFLPFDIPACAEIIALSLTENDGQQAAQDMIEGFNCPNPNYEWCQRIVAIKTGKIIGICGAYHLDTHPKDHAGICWYAVLPNERKQGIGKALLAESERMALEHGFHYIFAWTIDSAISYYERNGYASISPESIVPKESYLLARKLLK